MKKQLLLLMMMLLPMVTMADAVEIDGIYYNLVSKTKEAVVTSNPNKYKGKIIIPESIIYEGTVYSVNSIGSTAFYFCEGLSSITIPQSISSIGTNAFSACWNLNSVIIFDLESWCKIDFGLAASNPLEYTQHFYLNDEELIDIAIPSTITSIKPRAFQHYKNLKNIIIPNTITSIGEYAFQHCDGLTNVIVPNSVEEIDLGVFRYCKNLTNITLSNKLTSLKRELFQGCESLKSIIIPDNVTNIGLVSFAGCSELTTIVIPNSVTRIESQAFYSCSSLSSLTIGSGVKHIFSNAFNGCKELVDVYCLSTEVPYADTDIFDNSLIEYATLHVPTNSIDAYMAAEPWKNFKTIVGLDGTTPETKKCATPTISFANGKLQFSCETEGVEFVSEVTAADAKKNYSDEVSLTCTYQVSVYATKSGYDNSDVATMEIDVRGLKGDVNADGEVNVGDIVTVTNIMAGKEE